MGLFDKAKDLASEHGDKLETLVDKAGDVVDDKTGGKHAEHVDKVQDALRDRLADGDRR